MILRRSTRGPRAGIVSWWLLAAPVVGFAGFFVPVPGAILVGMFVSAAPMIVVGVRLIQRASARVRREELADRAVPDERTRRSLRLSQRTARSCRSGVRVRRIRCRGR